MNKSAMVVITKADDESRVIRFAGSTGDMDRDGEVIEPRGWDIKNYKKNPVFLWGHSHSQPPIGRTIKVEKTDSALVFDVEFPTEDIYPFADTIFKLYKNNYLNAVSVGFIPKEWKDGNPDDKTQPRRRFLKQELLELSGCSIPSNYNAVVMAREAGCISEKEEAVVKYFDKGQSADVLELFNVCREKLDIFLAGNCAEEEEKAATQSLATSNSLTIKTEAEPIIQAVLEVKEDETYKELMARLDELSGRIDAVQLEIKTLVQVTNEEVMPFINSMKGFFEPSNRQNPAEKATDECNGYEGLFAEMDAVISKLKTKGDMHDVLNAAIAINSKLKG